MVKCIDCKVRRACRFTFGDFYGEKSGGGKGCNHPFTERHAEAVLVARKTAIDESFEQLKLTF